MSQWQTSYPLRNFSQPCAKLFKTLCKTLAVFSMRFCRNGDWREMGRGECSFKLYRSYGTVNFMRECSGDGPNRFFSADSATSCLGLMLACGITYIWQLIYLYVVYNIHISYIAITIFLLTVVLPSLAWVLLNNICKPISFPLYMYSVQHFLALLRGNNILTALAAAAAAFAINLECATNFLPDSSDR